MTSPNIVARSRSVKVVWKDFLPHLHRFVIALIAASASILLVLILPGKLGVSPDATQYLTVANSLREGRGLSTLWWSGHYEPMSHFPPMYPLVIAGVSYIVGNVERAAFIINLILAPLIIVLLAMLTREMLKDVSSKIYTQTLMFISVSGALMCHLVNMEALALSEGLFIALMLGVFILVMKGLNSHHFSSRWFLLAAFFVSISTLTRYIGIVLIGCFCLHVLFLSRGTLKNRFISACVVGLIAIFPTLLWMLRNLSTAGTASNRTIAFHPISLSALEGGVRTVVSWFVPTIFLKRMQLFVLGVYAVIGIIVFVQIVRLRRPPRKYDQPVLNAPILVLGSFVFLYFAFLIVSISLFDRATDLDNRILLPVQVLSIVLITSVLVRLIEFRISAFNRATAWKYISVLSGVYVFFQTVGLVVWIQSAKAEGLGATMFERAHPEFVHAIRELPKNAYVYSNRPSEVHYLADRISVGLIEKYSQNSLLPNEFLEADKADLLRRSRTRETYLVYFGRSDNSHMLSLPEIQRTIRFEQTGNFPGGVIFRMRSR